MLLGQQAKMRPRPCTSTSAMSATPSFGEPDIAKADCQIIFMELEPGPAGHADTSSGGMQKRYYIQPSMFIPLLYKLFHSVIDQIISHYITAHYTSPCYFS